jgi:hypothetical protein
LTNTETEEQGTRDRKTMGETDRDWAKITNFNKKVRIMGSVWR